MGERRARTGDAARSSVVVFFWSFRAICVTMQRERVAELREALRREAWAFVAVHQPRRRRSWTSKPSRRATENMHLTQPCAIDNDHAIVDRFQNQFVPAFYRLQRAPRAGATFKPEAPASSVSPQPSSECSQRVGSAA